MSTLGLAGAAGALALVGSAAYHGFDLAKQRFLSMYRPSWETMGEAKKYGEQGGTVRYVKGQETLVKGMYEIPYDIARERAGMIASSVLDTPGKMYNKYKISKAFDKIKGDPSIRAMGVDRARQMFLEVGELAPEIVRKAPSTVVPAIQNAILTDSTGLRPDFVYNITKADQAMR